MASVRPEGDDWSTTYAYSAVDDLREGTMKSEACSSALLEQITRRQERGKTSVNSNYMKV